VNSFHNLYAIVQNPYAECVVNGKIIPYEYCLFRKLSVPLNYQKRSNYSCNSYRFIQYNALIVRLEKMSIRQKSEWNHQAITGKNCHRKITLASRNTDK